MMRDLKKWQFRIIFILAAAILVSCGSKSRSWKGNSKSAKDSIKLSLLDSMIVSAESSKDYERKYVLADSLEKTGDFSAVKANYLRGTAMRSLEKKADAELYFKKALEVEDLGDKDVFYYMRSARVLSQMLSVKNDYESVLRVATPAVEKLDGHPKAQSRD